MTAGFTAADVPEQVGKTFFVTGANTGLGFEASLVLAGKGARVLLGCRNRGKADDARRRILAQHRAADVAIVSLDLGDLVSVKAAAGEVAREQRLDGLINNAGLMVPPLQRTEQGFESQFGVNHLGHFALTGHLLPKLQATPGARIVNTSSNAHKTGDIDFDDPNAERGYNRLGRYSMSKIANLLFTFELHRRLAAAGSDVVAATCHPGGSTTDLMRHLGPLKALLPLARPFLNSAAQGAWPTLMAATKPGVQGNQYFGPRGPFELAGPAVEVQPNRKSQDPERARKLWELSEQLTGVSYLSM